MMTAEQPKEVGTLGSRLLRVRMGTAAVLLGLFVTGAVFFAEAQAAPAKNESSSKFTSGASKSPSKAASKAKIGQVALKPTTTSAPATTADPEIDVYRIGVEDELQILVWREPDLTATTTVRPDGKITLPLLNDVSVLGLTTDELQAQLTDKLKNFVNEPQVTVIPRQIRSRKVSVFGEVVRQGTYPVNGRKTILELLGEAGGLGPFAKSESIYILRRQGDQQVRIPFHYKKALAGQTENIVLRPGDMVIVP